MEDEKVVVVLTLCIIGVSYYIAVIFVTLYLVKITSPPYDTCFKSIWEIIIFLDQLDIFETKAIII